MGNRELSRLSQTTTGPNRWIRKSLCNRLSYDIKDKLTKGQNVICVKAVNAGDSPNPAGMIASLKIVYADGKTEIINSNKQWRCARKIGKDWKKLSFDDSTWVNSKTAAKFGGKPWGKISPQADRITPARYFRTEFKAKKQISKATAYICGLGYNKLFVNDSRIGNRQIDPILRDYSKQSPYSVYDVTEHVKKGSNAIGVILGNGRFHLSSLNVPTKTLGYGLPRVLLQLEITYADGSSGTIVSDNNWTATDNGPIRNHSDYNGETYDARMEMPGWSKAKFNESAWQKAVIVDPPKGNLTSSSLMQPMRITSAIKPVKLTEPKPGVWVFDLGQNIVGWCTLKIKAAAGTTVKMHFSENLYPDGMIDYRNLRAAKCTDYYICKGKGLESYRPSFTYHGFRYIEVTGLKQKPTLDTLLGEIVNTDMPFAGDFQCSDPTITQILKNARWGIRGNYLSIPTDCPQRDERQGWQGDRAAEQLGETFLFNNQLLYEKWMGDIRDSQRPDGNLSDVCPNYWPLYRTNVTWPACFVIVPGNIYRQNGDMRAIQRNYPYMAKWIDHLRTFVKDGIIEKDNYGDWCVPPESKELIHSKQPWRKTPKNVMATTYYYHVLTLMAEYARLQGLDGDVKKYQDEAAQIKTAFNQKLYDKDKGYYGNGSQTSQILPLRFGMVPKNREKKIFDYIVNHIETKTGGAIGTGLIGGQWLMRSLSDNGRIDIAYRFATRRQYPSWGYMIDNGATTIWELWNGNTANPAMNSGNHVMLLGDLVIWMFEYLGGIQADVTQPGFKHIIMNPQIIGDLTFANAQHDSPYGKIKSHWKIADGSFKWNITIPVNTTATVYIPAKKIDDITESDQNVSNAPGVKFLRMENNKAVFTLGSGSYKFISKHYEDKPNKPAPLVTADIDWPSFLARHDLVWTKLPTKWYEAPFLGNGLLGTQIRQKSDTSIRFDIGRSDVQERRPLSEGGAIFARSRLPIGHFSLDTVGKIVGGNMRLRLHDAEATGTIKTDKGSIELRCFVHTDEMVLIVEAKPNGGEVGCRFQFHPEEAIAPRMNTRRRIKEGYVPNPPFVLSETDGIGICTQDLLRGGQTATAWRAKSKGDMLTLHASVAHTPRDASADQIALETIQRIETTPINDLLSSHRRWWHDYYTESFISLSDTYWESFYWIQMYKLASATRENRGLIDNQGPWLQPTPWAGAWWNLNVQLSYWPTITANRLHLTESLLDRLDNHVQALIDAVPEQYRHDSAGIGRVSGQELVSGISYPLGVPGQNNAEIGSLPWALHDYWLAYRATMDDQRLREKLFPLLKRSINYYLHFLEEDDDGKLHLPTTYSPEYGSGPDCNYDLALLRWGCQTLLQICERLNIDDPLIPKWQNVLAKLTDYPVNKNGYMIARGVPFAKGHRHFSHLLMCYPLYLETIEKPGAKELAFKTVKHWHSLGSSRGYSLTGASSISSAYGDGNAALKHLNGLRPYLQTTTMYKEAGPVIETPLAAAQSIHDMLLQSWGDKIRIFPATADAWPNVVFHNLRTEGAFLISAMRANGKTKWIRIRSLAGQPCKLIPNMQEPLRVMGNTTSALKPLGRGIFEISLAKGDEILLYTGNELPNPKVKPIPPQQEQNTFGLKQTGK